MLTYAPDADPNATGVIYDATNLRPTTRGYTAYATATQYGGASGWPATDAYNLYAHQYQTGGRIIAGSGTQLWELSRTGFGTYTKTDVSGHTYTAYSATSTDEELDPAYWAFTSFGQYCIATSKSNALPQIQTSKGGTFANLLNAPNASTLCTFKNFVIAGNVGNYNSITGRPDMLAWSALGNQLDWVPSAATQSGFQQLVDIPGRIVCIKPLGDAVAVYKSNGIWLMRYSGNSAQPFSFQLVDNHIGCNTDPLVPPPVIDIGRAHLFVGRAGVYIFDGASVREIGLGVIADTIRQAQQRSASLRCPLLLHDIRNQEVFFSWGWSYNYRRDKWGKHAMTISVACQAESPLLGGGDSGVITEPGMIFITSGGPPQSLYRAPGDPAAYTYPTTSMSMIRGSNGDISMLRRVIPRFVTAPSSGVLSYVSRTSMGGSGTTATTSALTSNLRFDLRASANWHDVAMQFLSGSTPFEVVDVQVDFDTAGQRTEGKLVSI